MNLILKKLNNIKLYKKPLDKKNGFTLIEMIVVLAILGILIAIATPSLKFFTEESNETSLDTTTQAMYNVVVNKMVDATGTNVKDILDNPDLFSLQNLTENDVHFEFTTSVNNTLQTVSSIVSANPDKYVVLIPVVDTTDYLPDFTQDVVIVQPNSDVMFINGEKY